MVSLDKYYARYINQYGLSRLLRRACQVYKSVFKFYQFKGSLATLACFYNGARIRRLREYRYQPVYKLRWSQYLSYISLKGRSLVFITVLGYVGYVNTDISLYTNLGGLSI